MHFAKVYSQTVSRFCNIVALFIFTLIESSNVEFLFGYTAFDVSKLSSSLGFPIMSVLLRMYIYIQFVHFIPHKFFGATYLVNKIYFKQVGRLVGMMGEGGSQIRLFRQICWNKTCQKIHAFSPVCFGVLY